MKKIDHEHLVHLEEIYETSKVSNPNLTLFFCNMLFLEIKKMANY